MRYMAPEVALNQPYNQYVDMYSFAIILWQMLANQMPFSDVEASKFKEQVIVGGARPEITRFVLKDVEKFLNKGWSPDVSQRPSFSEAEDLLCGLLPAAIFAETRPTIKENGRRRSTLFQFSGQGLFPPPLPGIPNTVVDESALKAKELVDALNSAIATHFRSRQFSSSNMPFKTLTSKQFSRTVHNS